MTMQEHNEEVRFQIGEVTLAATLGIPEHALGMVLFAHGSGSSRHSPRNRFVAATLRKAGLGTLLFDLLTKEEETEDLTRRASDQARYIVRAGGLREIDAGGPAWLENFG